MGDSLKKNLKYIFYFILIVIILLFGKHKYDELTAESTVEQLTVQDKYYYNKRGNNRYVLIAGEKEFKVDKEEYDQIEVGYTIYIKYNSKTHYVRDLKYSP